MNPEEKHEDLTGAGDATEETLNDSMPPPDDDERDQPELVTESSSDDGFVSADDEGQDEPELVIQPSPRAPAFSFAHMLVESGTLTEEQVAIAQEASRQERLPLGRILERDGLVLSRDLAALIALHTGYSMVDLRSQTLDPRAISLLPEDIARKYLVLPIHEVEGRLTVAMADPTDLQAIQDLTCQDQAYH